MKIKNKISQQVIDVSSEHASMLMTQGWEEYHAMQEQRKEAPKEVRPTRKTKGE